MTDAPSVPVTIDSLVQEKKDKIRKGNLETLATARVSLETIQANWVNKAAKAKTDTDKIIGDINTLANSLDSMTTDDIQVRMNDISYAASNVANPR